MILVYTDALLTLAEVSATFAGFAALVTLFARRRMEGAAVHDLLRLRLVRAYYWKTVIRQCVDPLMIVLLVRPFMPFCFNPIAGKFLKAWF